jgi:hypothetical protein
MTFAGPAIVELPTTTIVVGPDDRSEILADGTVSIVVGGLDGHAAVTDDAR